MRRIEDIIDQAFCCVPYPGRENVCGSPSGEWEFEPLFKCEVQWRKDWRKIPAGLIATEVRDILPLFSAAGYRFFLPAYMKTALLAIKYPFNDDYGTLLMFVIFGLCPSDDFDEHHAHQISLFNGEQKHAVAAFLKHIRQYHTYGEDGLCEYDGLIASALERKIYE